MKKEIDMLEEIFKRQQFLQAEKFVKDMAFNNEADKQQYINMMLLACYAELSEIQAVTQWKHKSVPYGWKKQMRFDSYEYKSEIVDLLHFIINLWLADNGTAEELYKMFCEKNLENIKRQQNGY